MCVKCDFLLNSENDKTYKNFALPGATLHYSPDKQIQVRHIFLDLEFDIPNNSLTGICKIKVSPISKNINNLVLDAVDLQIKSVKIDGSEFKYEYDSKKISIDFSDTANFNSEFTIEIDYSVSNPQKGIYFVHPNKNYPNKPVQVWTQGESEDSRYWFPCFDYTGQLATSEIKAKVPKNFTLISNGNLENETDSGDFKIFHWVQKQIHPSYLIALVIGEFVKIEGGKHNGKPLTYFAEKSRADDLELTTAKTPEMIEFLSTKLNYPYPYDKYAQCYVDDFIFGGMENTSCTIITDRGLVDQKASIDFQFAEAVVIHELAHQWFGDLVVAKHWSHAWLKEGAVTYMEAVWWNYKYGNDDGQYYRFNDSKAYFDEDLAHYRRPIVTNKYRESVELYDRHLYEKGSWVYHMVRAELGEELFWKTISTFLHDNAHANIETIDLIRAIEKTTGRNLLPLFDQYVFRGGHPNFKLSFNWDGNNKLAKFTVIQTQAKNDSDDKNLFDLKIPLTFGFVNQEKISNSKKFTLHINKKEQSFYFNLENKPTFVSFDQGNNYLKTVELDYSFPDLKNLLKYDSDIISRIFAAGAIAKKGGLEAVKTLGESLINDTFWGVRVELIKALSDIKLNQVYDVILPALNDANSMVRAAAVEALGKIKTEASLNELLNIIQKGDSSYMVEAMANSAAGQIISSKILPKENETKVIEILNQTLETKSGWNEVVRSGALSGLSKLSSSEEALNIIINYTKLGIPESLRRTAIRCLGAVSKGQTKEKIHQIIEILSELSKEPGFLTEVAVISALGQINSPAVIPILKSCCNQVVDGRAARMAEETVAKVMKLIGPDESIKELQNELESVKKINQELSSRLENLEAKSK